MKVILTPLRNAGGSRSGFVESAVPNRVHRILDVGCSYGWELGKLSSKADELWGIDMDADALSKARTAYPHIRFVHQTAASLPFPDGMFEVVILSEVIEHVGDENKQLVIDEAHRVLKAGGLLILTAPHAGIFAWADPLDFKRRCKPLYRLYMRFSGRTPNTPMQVGHKHVTLKELCALFRERFDLDRVRYCGLIAPWLGWVNGLGTCLPIRLLSRRAEDRLGEFTAWESGIGCPRWLSFYIRILARKKGTNQVGPESGQMCEGRSA